MALVALLAGVSAVAPPNGAGRLSDSAFRLREQSSLAAANPRDGQSVAELLTWEQWLVQFGKSYDDDAEHARRRAVFEINLAHVHAHNIQADAGAHTFRAGVNAFTDLSSEEFLVSGTPTTGVLRNFWAYCNLKASSAPGDGLQQRRRQRAAPRGFLRKRPWTNGENGSGFNVCWCTCPMCTTTARSCGASCCAVVCINAMGTLLAASAS